jgi:hypothetical protein
MLALVVALGGILLSGCGGQSQKPTQQQSQVVDLVPFVSLAHSSACTDLENRLFVIDGTTVVWDRKGNCPDSSYAVTLYGSNVDTVYCNVHDSVAGPVQACSVPGYLDLFNTISTHLTQPDLGLGQGHTVQQVVF